jgi:hypothetical protein
LSKIFLCFFSLFIWGSAYGRGVVPKMPSDFDQVDVYLLTVKRGDAVYALYGHTILRVVDRVSGADYNFNWGIFDFRAKDFVWKFYIGDLNYQLAITDFYSLVDHYRVIEKRAVIQDRINLTNLQKQTLMRRLIWNAEPENIFYQYNQFSDNCSTKPRDYLDEALAGKIREFYGTRVSSENFRSHIRRNASPSWWVELGLDTVSNNLLDAPITNWQEMFLPQNFRELLLELPAFDDQGHAIAGKNLLEEHELIIDLPEPAQRVDPYYLIALAFGFMTVSCAVFTLNGMFKDGPPKSSGQGIFVLLGVVLLLFGLWNSIWGTLMTFNWIFSRYAEVQANALLLLYWPFDWFWVLLGLFFVVKRRRLSAHAPGGKIAISLGLLHMTCITIAAILCITKVITQNIFPHLLISGLSGMLIYWLVLRIGLNRGDRR